MDRFILKSFLDGSKHVAERTSYLTMSVYSVCVCPHMIKVLRRLQQSDRMAFRTQFTTLQSREI